MFRHDTWNEYWAWFCEGEDSPATAAKIASKECPEEAPRATSPGTFGTKEVTRAYVCPVRRCRRRWRQLQAAASRAAALLRELLDSMTPVEARDRAMAEIGGVAVAEEGGFN